MIVAAYVSAHILLTGNPEAEYEPLNTCDDRKASPDHAKRLPPDALVPCARMAIHPGRDNRRTDDPCHDEGYPMHLFLLR